MSLGLTGSEGWKIPKVNGVSLRPTNFLKKPERKEDSTFFVGAEIRSWVIAGVVAITSLGYGVHTLIQKSDETTEHYTRIVTGILDGKNTSHTRIGKLPIGEIESLIVTFEKENPGSDPIEGLRDRTKPSLKISNSSGK